MTQDIRVPEVSDGVESGTVVAIAVSVGDTVEEDQTLLEMETDKAVIEIPSPSSGTITAVNVSEGDTVDIGAVIMTLEPKTTSGKTSGRDEPSESTEFADAESTSEESQIREDDTKEDSTDRDESSDREDIHDEEPSSEVSQERNGETEQEPAVDQTESPRESTAEATATVDLQTKRRNDQVAPASPTVRRLARELGVDIYQVQGTGPGGRISSTDLRHYVHDTMQRITGGGSAPSAHGEFPGLHAQRPLPDFSRWGAVTRRPLSKIREITADSMSYAWSTIPMVTQYDHAQISELETFRKDYNQTASSDHKLTVTAILVKVCATALKAFPEFNSSLDLAQRELILKEYIHIGVAVDTAEGLLVPVIRDADQKGVEDIALELSHLAEKARQRKLNLKDMEGGTFTISNLGGIGGSAFTPIVYAPQVAILGVSTAKFLPHWNGESFEPKLSLPLSLTYDHRVIDGAAGAQFLRWVCLALEYPLRLVMKG
ncbi:MAG: 2-oxo acid dehydrogenase subunit E2 [Deltaproteobacteria bacterium]|jgi:pyruvate dehydrogenase E2 component (dihydrolipoamide acetyltransferase)|nr:2-oxo acid dehydrogenase subunit E2 [Deltaproteobacteria bacterium]